ncbi:DUF4136 domain-containing protein [Novosphingobium sp. Leaf2]|uniref:DUF4136 domain-containing protein n=1 Tax=Novosphingobium sp. Leaf2 TaxID=1735670 RepID=UPI0006F7BEC3|nr:DUF4136 domain-containing protein [Novosphingobium sp. Leaf2]KQM22136.1 lipoprotein transmembrane [Novosphingobium sp. Leaf2]
MNENARSQLGRLRLAAAAVLLMALAACAAPFNANVSRFQSQLPAPAGQSFAIVADDPKLAGGLEFSQYASIVRDRMARLGYAPVEDPARATLIVRFDYGLDTGRERVTSTGIGAAGPWGPWGGYGFYGRRGGWGGFGFGGPWHYGWYDPFFDNSIQSYTVYTSGISLKIDRAADGQRLFEGKAEAVSTSNRLQYLVPNLVEAMFTNFPGNSGETVRITVAPEKK